MTREWYEERTPIFQMLTSLYVTATGCGYENILGTHVFRTGDGVKDFRTSNEAVEFMTDAIKEYLREV